MINNNPIPNNPVALQNAWITGYEDLGSTLNINSEGNKNPSYYTLLVINGTTHINDVNNAQNIYISGIRPVGVGLFVVEENSNGKLGVNFVGYAQQITVTNLP